MTCPRCHNVESVSWDQHPDFISKFLLLCCPRRCPVACGWHGLALCRPLGHPHASAAAAHAFSEHCPERADDKSCTASFHCGVLPWCLLLFSLLTAPQFGFRVANRRAVLRFPPYFIFPPHYSPFLSHNKSYTEGFLCIEYLF